MATKEKKLIAVIGLGQAPIVYEYIYGDIHVGEHIDIDQHGPHKVYDIIRNVKSVTARNYGIKSLYQDYGDTVIEALVFVEPDMIITPTPIPLS